MRPGARVQWVNGVVGDHEHDEAWKRQRIPAAGQLVFFAIYFPDLSSFCARVNWLASKRVETSVSVRREDRQGVESASLLQ